MASRSVSRLQAIGGARLIALYQANTVGLNRYWDLHPDQRDQVYGGIAGEVTPKSDEAVGQHFANCSELMEPDQGENIQGVFQQFCEAAELRPTAASRMRFPVIRHIMPLSEHVNGNICNASHYFNWGPIKIKKDELTRRIKIWAERKGKMEGRAMPEQLIAGSLQH